MPWAAKKPCANFGCPALVDRSERFCEAHRKQYARDNTRARRADPEKRERLNFYSSSAWRGLRAVHLGNHPLCVHCEREGRITPATVVDHIVEIKQGGGRLDPSNLQSLCASHHATKTLKDGGAW
jgi:5-methylcytosine-specific restriction protein A